MFEPEPLYPSGPAPQELSASEGSIGSISVPPKKRSNPFPGLRPFEETESSLFFGRQKHVSDLLARLRSHRFLAVIGVSGSGKSSLIRAGLVPRLRQGFLAGAGERWRTVLLRPGEVPLEALADALDQGFPKDRNARESLREGCGAFLSLIDESLETNENLLIVVDQFEEIFRYKRLTEQEGPEGRTNAVENSSDFVRLLVGALDNDRVHVVITMRSEYLGDCAKFHELPEQINNGQYLIPRLTADEQREIIVRPVWTRQAQISELLVQRLLDDVGPEPEQLPILQHVLARLWHDWANSESSAPISVENLENIGGFDKAMDQHAQRLYLDLPSDLHRWIAKRLFQRVTFKGTVERPIRRPRKLSDIRAVVADAGKDADMALGDVIEKFRNPEVGFLTSPDSGDLKPSSVIDISHESLCWLWSALTKWVSLEADSAEIYLRVSKGALLYSEAHDTGFTEGLYRDPALSYVWATYRPGQMSLCDPDKVDPWNQPWSAVYNESWKKTFDYLLDSKKDRDERRQRAIDLQKHRDEEEKQREEKERQRKEDERRRVEEEQRVEERRREEGRRQKERLWILGVAVGIVLVGLLGTLLTMRFLLGRLADRRRAEDYARQSEDQRSQLGSYTQERAALLSIKANQLSAIVSADVAAWESYERITQPSHVVELKHPVNSAFVIGDVGTPGSSRVIAQLLRVGAGEFGPPAVLDGGDLRSSTLTTDPRAPRNPTAISRDGKYVSGPCENGKARIWDTRFGHGLETECLKDIEMLIDAPDSEWLAAVEYAPVAMNYLRIFKVSPNGITTAPPIFLNPMPLTTVAFSPDGRFLAIVQKHMGVPVLELRMTSAPRTVVASVPDLSDEAPIAFSPDNHFLAAGMANGSITFIRLGTKCSVNTLSLASTFFRITAISISNNSQLLAYAEAGVGNIVRVAELRSPAMGTNVPEATILWSDYFGQPASRLTFSHNGKLLGLALGENTARIKEARTGFETVRVTHAARVNSIDFSRNDEVAFSASDDGEVRRFPTSNAISPEWATLPPCKTQNAAISDNGTIAAVACQTQEEHKYSSAVSVFLVKHSQPSLLTTLPPSLPANNPAYSCLVAVSWDGSHVVSECDSNFSMFVSTGTTPVVTKRLPEFQASLRSVQQSSGPKESIGCENEPTSIVLNRDGTMLAVGDDCGRFFAYSVTGADIHSVPIFNLAIDSDGQVVKERKNDKIPAPITAVGFSTNSKMVAVGTSYGDLLLAGMPETFAVHTWLQRSSGTVNTIRFSSSTDNYAGEQDSEALVWGAGGTASVLHVIDQQEVFRISGNFRITSVAFGPDGREAAAGTSDGKVYMFRSTRLSREESLERNLYKLFANYDPQAIPEADETMSGDPTQPQPILSLQFVDATTLAVAASQSLLVPFDRQTSGHSLGLPLTLKHHSFKIADRRPKLCGNLSKTLTSADLSTTRTGPVLTWDNVCKDELNKTTVTHRENPSQ